MDRMRGRQLGKKLGHSGCPIVEEIVAEQDDGKGLCRFGRSRLPDQLGPVGFEISLHRSDSPEADRHPLLTLEKTVMRERLANFHDLDVFVVHFPKLAFGQRDGSQLLRLDSFRCRRAFYHCKIHFHTLIG